MPHENHGTEADRECVAYLEKIVALIDGELAEGQCEVVRAHLESCNPCAARYDVQRTVKQVVARCCQEEAPGELRVRIMATLQSITIVEE